MKVLNGYVQNRTHPEDCIAEWYIVEETVEFYTEHLSDVNTVGVPQARRCDFQSHYHMEHMIHIKTTYPKFKKRTRWLQDKHNNTFIQWLGFKVQSELNGKDNNGLSKNLRWLAGRPSMAVSSYRSYLINDVKFNTKAQDDV
ncbi:unnamed protein product [Prunus armeniaca]